MTNSILNAINLIRDWTLRSNVRLSYHQTEYVDVVFIVLEAEQMSCVISGCPGGISGCAFPQAFPLL
jgi:hypothetical protein